MYLTRNQRNKESFCKLLLNPENNIQLGTMPEMKKKKGGRTVNFYRGGILNLLAPSNKISCEFLK